MTAPIIAVVRPTEAGEQRVALVPEVAGKLIKQGAQVVVERDAGAAAFFPDAAYEAVGAEVGAREQVLGKATVLVALSAPDAATLDALPKGAAVVGLLGTRIDNELVDALVARGLTGLDLSRLPRTLSRTQTMDALSSQSSVAGYRAVLVAAEAFGRYMSMMITAAGTAKPAKVLVLGTGVAGLQAIGTAKRLGAVVTGYDVRPASRGEVESLGASWLDAGHIEAKGEGGYARELTPQEHAQQQAALSQATAAFDIVITTAQVPGRRPPVLVTAETVAKLAPGSVVLDMAASSLGGNVEGSAPGERIMTDGGVLIIGANQLASEMPTGASMMYARNVASLLAVCMKEGQLVFDMSDEVLDAVTVVLDGQSRLEGAK